MANQTITRSAESESEPAEIYNVLADVANIPTWAPVFADSVECLDDTRARLTKNGETFNIEIFLYPSAGTVDYIREMPNNKRGGAYLRVTPRPLGGSTVTMTVPLAPNASESETTRTLDQELTALIQLARY